MIAELAATIARDRTFDELPVLGDALEAAGCTDRELLERASSLPQVETLRELISLHDRAWFGLKGATAEEADHARDLADRAVA